jgi:RimJ/RimL family protein N-acetyltransferase/ubiquinone/menaquinone biosynthesis C-methylase UbiE
MMSIGIETKRLVLRNFEASDAQAAADNSQQPQVAHWMANMVLKDEAAAVGWIDWINGKCEASSQMRVFAIERKEDHLCIGLIGFAPKKELHNEIEICYAIADPYQGNGYATEAAKALVWQAFEQVGLDLLVAIVRSENTASRRVLEKLGFIYVDTQIISYNGQPTRFNYYRLYHIETLPDPQWNFGNGSDAEEMGAFFNRRADGYEVHMTECGFDSETYRRASAPLPRTDQTVRILDLGCGTGLELQYLFARMPNARVTCIDLSKKMLAILVTNYRERTAQLEIIRDSYLTWDYPEAQFDYVISVNTMHHLLQEPKTQLYRKINRTLKPGGIYCESDFMVDEARMAQYQARYQRIMDHGTISGQNGFYHIDIPFTIPIQKKLLLQAGFAKVEVFYENINPTGSGAVLAARRSA